MEVGLEACLGRRARDRVGGVSGALQDHSATMARCCLAKERAEASFAAFARSWRFVQVVGASCLDCSGGFGGHRNRYEARSGGTVERLSPLRRDLRIRAGDAELRPGRCETELRRPICALALDVGREHERGVAGDTPGTGRALAAARSSRCAGARRVGSFPHFRRDWVASLDDPAIDGHRRHDPEIGVDADDRHAFPRSVVPDGVPRRLLRAL